MSSEPLHKCPACGFVRHDLAYDCAVCAIQADYLEQELKRWIADRYRAKGLANAE